MRKHPFDLQIQEPLLNIVSYGRAGPRSLSRSQRELISRTVRRTPEVMVKVSGGARTLAGVEQSLRYYARDGKLGMESDTGEHLATRGFDAELVRDWNLDLEVHRRQNARAVRAARKPSRLVHNIIFSMPPGTSSKKVLKAAGKLVREEFAFRHRYAMVLHTDEPHPHVHVVVKAVSEQGERLYIRKPTLRDWRRRFAENLRELGVAANATERAVRGLSRTRKPDGVYRAAQRGTSTYIRDLVQRAASDDGKGAMEPGKETLLATRNIVVTGWRNVSERLRGEGYPDLAREVDRFVERMPPAKTEKESLIGRLRRADKAPEMTPPHRTR
jgi:type IV secretory pathway VirD2 relaxase